MQAEAKGFKEPAPFDGLVEVVGFNDAYSASAVMSGVGHAVRLGQSSGVRVHVCSESGRKGQEAVYMQLDGEPWKQTVPCGLPNGGNELTVRTLWTLFGTVASSSRSNTLTYFAIGQIQHSWRQRWDFLISQKFVQTHEHSQGMSASDQPG
jgi:hypothetical protein